MVDGKRILDRYLSGYVALWISPSRLSKDGFNQVDEHVPWIRQAILETYPTVSVKYMYVKCNYGGRNNTVLLHQFLWYCNRSSNFVLDKQSAIQWVYRQFPSTIVKEAYLSIIHDSKFASVDSASFVDAFYMLNHKYVIFRGIKANNMLFIQWAWLLTKIIFVA